jgi:DmsE family decaheme c-type cytochrome
MKLTRIHNNINIRRYQLPEKIFMRKKTVSLIRVMMVVAVIILVGFLGFVKETTAAEKGAKGAEVMEKCAQCHEDVVKAFNANAHNALGALCTDCHGTAEKHMAEGGALDTIVGFKKESSLKNAAQCLKCHKTSASQFMSGPHGKASLDCTQCHGIHSKTVGTKLLKQEPNKLCSTCHQEIYSQFMLNERHRLQEGILQCTTCHNVHEPAARVRLGGFKNETCAQCHRDKNGPFVYEHAASRIEGCTVCHEVHGSPNRHMLKHQVVSELCFSCHTQAPSWHSRFTTTETNCVTCHSAIHGSNLDKLFLK